MFRYIVCVLSHALALLAQAMHPKMTVAHDNAHTSRFQTVTSGFMEYENCTKHLCTDTAARFR